MPNRKNRKPLVNAIKAGNLETLKSLLTPDIDVNQLDDEGLSLIDHASLSENPTVYAFLLNFQKYENDRSQLAKVDRLIRQLSDRVAASLYHLPLLEEKSEENCFESCRQNMMRVCSTWLDEFANEKDEACLLDLYLSVNIVHHVLMSSKNMEALQCKIKLFFGEREDALRGDTLDYCHAKTLANKFCYQLATILFPNEKPENCLLKNALSQGRVSEWKDSVMLENNLPSFNTFEFFRDAHNNIELYQLILDRAIARLQAGDYAPTKVFLGTDVVQSVSYSLPRASVALLSQRAPTFKKLVDYVETLEILMKNNKKSIYDRFFDLLAGLKDGDSHGKTPYFYLMNSLPDSDNAKYHGAYFYINHSELFYISYIGQVEKVNLSDRGLFNKNVAEMMGSAEYKKLTSAEVSKTITENGGHTPTKGKYDNAGERANTAIALFAEWWTSLGSNPKGRQIQQKILKMFDFKNILDNLFITQEKADLKSKNPGDCIGLTGDSLEYALLRNEKALKNLDKDIKDPRVSEKILVQWQQDIINELKQPFESRLKTEKNLLSYYSHIAYIIRENESNYLLVAHAKQAFEFLMLIQKSCYTEDEPFRGAIKKIYEQTSAGSLVLFFLVIESQVGKKFDLLREAVCFKILLLRKQNESIPIENVNAMVGRYPLVWSACHKFRKGPIGSHEKKIMHNNIQELLYLLLHSGEFTSADELKLFIKDLILDGIRLQKLFSQAVVRNDTESVIQLLKRGAIPELIIPPSLVAANNIAIFNKGKMTDFKVGDWLNVNDGSRWIHSIILEIKEDRSEIKVHYAGWRSSYDAWIKSSDLLKIAPFDSSATVGSKKDEIPPSYPQEYLMNRNERMLHQSLWQIAWENHNPQIAIQLIRSNMYDPVQPELLLANTEKQWKFVCEYINEIGVDVFPRELIDEILLKSPPSLKQLVAKFIARSLEIPEEKLSLESIRQLPQLNFMEEKRLRESDERKIEVQHKVLEPAEQAMCLII
ncbi:MAG: hypothetical protein SFW66_08695 [Gammaproteobacteria bacterium]|nr:hypothetical protein [Gammaproteobacteria bacterium]